MADTGAVAREFSRRDLPLVLISVFGTICTLVLLLRYSGYGFDFSDEGYYTVWIATPFNYRVSSTQFGYVYHALYWLLEGNLAALRQANIIITFVLGWSLVHVFLRNVCCLRNVSRNSHLAITASLASGGLLLFQPWLLLTPSYNSLALQGVMVATTGLLLVEKEHIRTALLGSVIIGIGGWLAFMGKPTTAAALAAVSLAHLLLTRRLNLTIALVCIVTAMTLLLLSALYIDHSILKFVERLKNEVVFQEVFKAGHDFSKIFRIDGFGLRLPEWRLIFLLAVVVWVYYIAALAKFQLWFILLSLLVSVIFCINLLVIPNQLLRVLDFYNSGLLILAVPVASILCVIPLSLNSGFSPDWPPKLALVMTFLVLPYVFAFGTGNNYWTLASAAGLFWVLAGLTLMSAVKAERGGMVPRLLVFGIFTQLITVVLLRHSIEHPYRQPQPLSKNTHITEVGRSGSNLVVDQGFGRYIDTAKKVAKDAEFRPGTPIIDLTGLSPGILYAMHGRIMGRPWTPGGYPGSNKFASLFLNLESCDDLSAAWLLVEPDGPGMLSSTILSSFGANLLADFVDVANFDTPPGAGGYDESRKQVLYKPRRQMKQAVDSCIQKR